MPSGELIEAYLRETPHRGAAPDGAFSGAAGGAPCGDLLRISASLSGGALASARFEARGCATARAAAAAACELVEGGSVLDAARTGPEEIAEALGGLSPHGLHAAELAADALHRALGAAAASGVSLSGPPVVGERVLVAMSGGVDSAVAALLEGRRASEAVAVTLKLWADRRTDAERSCCSPHAVLSARRLAHSMGLPHLTLDLEESFRSRVVGSFVRGYEEGRTPNPCILCNGELRIDAMADLAGRLGAGTLATGHYARIGDDGTGPLLVAPSDPDKDQTYMLSALDPATLSRLRFPLADLRKEQVRELAREASLPVASKKESQDLCFLAGEGKRSFLARHASRPARPGPVVDTDGNVLGRHRGAHELTVGQRRGLGVAAGEPLYVLATDVRSNTVVAGPREALERDRIRLRDATLHRPGGRVDRVRLRYHAPTLPCRVAPLEPGRHGELLLELQRPAQGVAPGQAACLMDGDAVVGHGTIAG